MDDRAANQNSEGTGKFSILNWATPEMLQAAMGVASHGIATAHAFSEGEIAGSFAGLGMVLNAILTALVVPPVVRLIGYS